VSWFHLPIVGQFLAPGVETEFAPGDTAATDALIDHLREARDDGATMMAWLHLYSPHDPYVPQSEFPFGNGKRNAYLSEVAYFDRELGRLMQYLDDEHWLEDTLVIFFSDHGEALGEGAYWGHHVYLDAWMIDVPLMLWHSDLRPTQPSVGVSLADVAPTVLHFLGLPLPGDIAAQSLLALDPTQAGRATFSEAFPVRGRQLFESFRLPALDDQTIRARLRSIRQSSEGYEPKGAITRDQYRLIHHRGADAVIFYDHGLDPNERSSQGAGSPEFAELLRSELERWEQEQLRRIRCRLQLSADPTATSHPR
jgi:arylsulfatase A-like enzyme